VFLLIWLKLIFSVSEVAGYNATGQVTSERRKKLFQLARAKGSKVPKSESSTLGAGVSDRCHDILDRAPPPDLGRVDAFLRN
jgi:hypothetical protein